MTAKKVSRTKEVYVVEFRVEVDAPDEGDDTAFIVENSIRDHLETFLSRDIHMRCKFGAVTDVGAMEDIDNAKGGAL